MNSLINELIDQDDKMAYAKTKIIAAESEISSKYYPYLDAFASLLNDEKSYIRTRAFLLCCSQAKWDKEDKLEKLLPKLLLLFHDPKPTVVRQCLNASKEIAVFKPALSKRINDELNQIDLSKYKENMAKLIKDDIISLKDLIKELNIPQKE